MIECHIPPPKEKELLSSWLVRCSIAHGINPYLFCKYLMGCGRIWYSDIDRASDSNNANLIKNFFVLTDEQMERMTLNQFHSNSPQSACLPQNAFINHMGIYHTERYLHSLQFCPICLKESSHFKVDWRIAIKTHCHTHQCSFLDSCPKCDASINLFKSRWNEIDRCYVCNFDFKLGPIDIVDQAYSDWEAQLFSCLKSSYIFNLPLDIAKPKEYLLFTRILLSFSSHQVYLPRLQKQLNISPNNIPHRTIFETSRLNTRYYLLTLLKCWLMREREEFLSIARKIGLTQRFFENAAFSDHRLISLVSNLTRFSSRNQDKAIIPAQVNNMRNRKPSIYRTIRAHIYMEKIKNINENR